MRQAVADPPSMRAFSKTLRLLMDHHSLNQTQAGQKTGLGQTTVSKILRNDPGTALNIRTMDDACLSFRVQTWKAIVPGITLPLLLNQDLDRLVACYINASPEAQAYLRQVAEREAEYRIAPAAAQIGNK